MTQLFIRSQERVVNIHHDNAVALQGCLPGMSYSEAINAFRSPSMAIVERHHEFIAEMELTIDELTQIVTPSDPLTAKHLQRAKTRAVAAQSLAQQSLEAYMEFMNGD